MDVIGVLGGVASGKSVVAEMFESLGAVRLDADAAGRAVLQDPDVVKLLMDQWGRRIVDQSGTIDRQAIANIVFAETPEAHRELEFLESISHPRITERLEAQIASLADEGRPAAVLDAAVMLKAGWDRWCNRFVFVDVARSQRLNRALERGWSKKQFEAREAAQCSLASKRQRADTMIDNSGSLEETLKQVKAAWSTWRNPSH